MRVNKTSVAVFIVGCLIFSVQAQCVIIKPSNVVLPASAGEIFSFDFVISDANATSALAFQATISVSGPGTLTLDEPNSEAVAKEAMYWFENSTSTTAFRDGNFYKFGDNTTSAEPLASNDIMARYAFVWEDGIEGYYTFTLDLNTDNSFVQNDSLEIEALRFTPDTYQGGDNYFIVNIPEPSTLVIFALGAMRFCLRSAIRKRSTLP